MKNKQHLLLSLFAAAALSACGGGSGGGSNSPSQPSSYSFTCADGTTQASNVSQEDAKNKCPVVPSSPVVTSVPQPDYSSGSEELSAFTLLNAERQRCGFGLLAQHKKLDVAARGHAEWMVKTGVASHFETEGSAGFVGVSPADRIISTGYSTLGNFDYTETLFTTGGLKTGAAAVAVRRLLNAPYHLIPMMRGYVDIGIGVRDSVDVGDAAGTRHAVNIDYAAKKADGMQTAGQGAVRTYPCDGSTGLAYSLTNESPNPVPGRNLGALPLGTSIAIVGDGVITITSATMTDPTGGAVALRPAITKVNDPNKVNGVSYFSGNEAYIAADAPLAADTKYQVNISGTTDGKSFSRSFSFTTGS